MSRIRCCHTVIDFGNTEGDGMKNILQIGVYVIGILASAAEQRPNGATRLPFSRSGFCFVRLCWSNVSVELETSDRREYAISPDI
jgi:hypothetical protein